VQLDYNFVIRVPRGWAMKVLVVEDDPAFRRYTCLALEEARIDHVTAGDAASAAALLAQPDGGAIDAVLLDIELPGTHGVELLTELRAHGNQVPILLISVRDGLKERVKALDLGADDYLVKPFEFPELVARLHAVTRRGLRSERVKVRDLELDVVRRHAERGGHVVRLTPLEFDLLWVLVQAHGRPVSRAELLQRVWHLDIDPRTNVVEVHASRLRRKLARTGEPLVETVRGQGYRVVP
jgi:DNA-binding response OmpR family regulator